MRRPEIVHSIDDPICLTACTSRLFETSSRVVQGASLPHPDGDKCQYTLTPLAAEIKLAKALSLCHIHAYTHTHTHRQLASGPAVSPCTSPGEGGGLAVLYKTDGRSRYSAPAPSLHPNSHWVHEQALKTLTSQSTIEEVVKCNLAYIYIRRVQSALFISRILPIFVF
jgi:hypothetical protein